MAKQKIPSTLIDRAIGYFSPETAFKRHKARTAMALTGGGGYQGGQYSDRLSMWQPGSGDADTNIVTDRRELIARSRDLVRNSPIAAGAIETVVTNVVGTGLSMQSHVDADYLGLEPDAAEEWQSNVEREFRMWAESTYCDAYEQQNFYEIQDLAFRSSLESGDSFILMTQIKRPDWPHAMALQVIEADRISNKDNSADTRTMVQGIEKTEDGRPLAVWVSDRHPQQWGAVKDVKWTRIPVRGQSGRVNIIQLFRKKRPGQTRGVPELAPVIEPLKQLGRYTEAEIAAAVVAGAFSVFVKMQPDAFQDLFDDSAQAAITNNAKRWDGTLQPGAAVNLLPGEEIQTADASRPNPNFDPFVTAIMKQVGIGLNVPYEVLSKHFQSSYSAARAALLDAWRTFKIRRTWLASSFCQVVYSEWLADAVASGRIQAPGFFADAAIRRAWSGASWNGDGPGAIDPMKEAEAAGKRMEIGLTTLAEEILSYDGGNWDEKHRQQVVERHEREEAGLVAPVTQPQPGAAAPMGGGQPQQGGPAQDDGAEDEQISEQGGMMALAGRVHALERVATVQPPNVTISAPITINQPPTNVSVASPSVNVAAPSVTVEAVMPEQAAPVVHVAAPSVSVEAPNVSVEANLPPAQVVVQHPTRAVQRVERDANDDIVATVTEYDLKG